MNYLGIDLGGINTVAAVVDEQGKILASHSLPTPRNTTPEAVAEGMARTACIAVERAGLSLSEIVSVGVGAPGTIDPERGMVEYWSNLDFHHVPLSALLSAQLERPVLLENDANAAALGEYAAGAGAGSTSMLAITLGTGVGGGAVLGGKLYTGFNHGGLEVGHFVIEHGGRPCTCGRLGCFEAYCSATALMKCTGEAMKADHASLLWTLAGSPEKADGRVVFEAARQGDPAAGRVVNEYLDYLGCGVASLVNVFQPQVFCIGGGVAGAGEALLGPVKAILDREDYARNQPRRTRLELARLGNDAGLIGAALLPLFR